MSYFRVIFVGVLCVYFPIVKYAASNPTELSGKHHKGNDAEQDGWISILSSIESRIKNLDHLYTSPLTPTLEKTLEQFQNRISGIELKLLRIEALLTTKLDRMSDNISSRHFRDDMVQTDLFRKIETAYDGVTHRLAYMERKSENIFLKIQGKAEVIAKKLEDMDDNLTSKYESIESEVSDCTAGMDDLKTMFNITEKNVLLSLERYSNVSSVKLDQMKIFYNENFTLGLADVVTRIHENTSRSFDTLRRKVNTQISMTNSTGKSMQIFSEDLEKMLNEYASKVSDLGAQVLKSDNKISTHLKIIETVANSSRSEQQNGLRALMVQVAKMSNKENSQYEDQRLLSDMSQRMGTGFEKIISTQNSFLESCHRVQMDESQIETQISDILNKLIDNFSDTTKEQHYLLKKIEGLLGKHDVHFKKELHQANTNILSIFDESKKNYKILNEELKKTTDNLEALFSLVQSVLGHSNRNWKRGISNERALREHIENLERALNFTKLEQIKMFDSYRATIETLMTLTESRNNENNNVQFLMENITGNILEVRNSIHNLSPTLNNNEKLHLISSLKNIYGLVKENNKGIVQIMNYTKNENPRGRSVKPEDENKKTNTSNTSKDSDIDALIKKVFFMNVTTTTQKTEISCLDFDIDVRYEGDKQFKNCRNQSKKVEIPKNNSDCSGFDVNVHPSNKCKTASNNTNNETTTQENIEVNLIEEPTTSDVDCLDFPIDVRYDPTENSHKAIKLCKNETKQINITEHQISMEHHELNITLSEPNLQFNQPILEIKNSTEYLDLNDLIN